MIPADLAERVTREKRKAREREQRRPKRDHHKPKIKNSERPFIGWDGEGPQDTGYSLFGSSEGDMICHPNLGTVECLDLILYREEQCPEAIHIWFGSNYDVSMILRDLSWKHLSALKYWTKTIWHGYSLEHVPHKWLEISKDGVTAKLYDIQSFFAGSYVTALLDMKVGTDEEILHLQSEKARRSVFLWSEIDSIRDYWRLELRLMPVLATTLRRTFLDAGFDVTSWHGPGSLANLAMRRHGIFDAMRETPADVRIAARYAFAGGRFELFRGGYFRERITNADIHSAYPAYARLLPNLARGQWRHGKAFESDKFAVYRIRYKSRFDPMRPYPLFRRTRSGEVVWTNECEGWYWAPEAELVCNDPDAEFLESLVFDEDDSGDRPFAWLDEYYRRRQYLKSIGSPLELTFKLIINSVYGQLAQRTGWDKDRRTAPKSHQLEWAGYITSSCRAAVWRAASALGDSLVSIDTDGLYSRGSDFRNLDIGPDLGQWEVEEYDGAIFWQSGIYSLRRNGEWYKGRTRGIPKGKYTADDLIAAMERNEPLKLKKKVFIGYGLAINGQRDKLNTWEKVPHEIVFGGQGKRYHNTEHWCGKIGCKTEGIHEFIPRTMKFAPGGIPESEPHYLPWLAADPLIEGRKRLADDYQMYDLTDLDEDEEWVRDYVN